MIDIKALIEVVESAQYTPNLLVYPDVGYTIEDMQEAGTDGFENFRDRMLVYLQQEQLKELDEKNK